ncbi:MAG: hypothetical protein JWO00_420 [Candidatus Parcubacteria bacterium]|nr:hypothetical protein [Candidatus Parcubacteria bacterium]
MMDYFGGMDSPQMTTQDPVVAKSCDMKIVLNGGSKVLDSATLPIQWFFEPEAMAKRPEWIVIVVQNTLKEEMWRYSTGQRYLFKVTDRIAFIQLDKPGNYQVLIAAVSGREPRWLLAGDYPGWYLYKIYWPTESKAASSKDLEFASYACEMFEVPEGLFAKQSESMLGKALWKWINRWHRSKPTDQCDYRFRAIIAFTAQPICVGTAYLFRYACALFATLVLGICRAAVLFFGYRPLFFSEIAKFWDYEQPIRHLSLRVLEYPVNGYRVWKRTAEPRWCSDPTDVLMPVTPLQVCLALGACYGLFVAYSLLSWETWLEILVQAIKYVALGVLAIALVFGLVKFCLAAFLDKKKLTEEKRSKLRKEEWELIKHQQDSYTLWLKQELSADRAPSKVDLKNLPQPFENKVAHAVRTKFWAAKVKVCRPFAQQ